jgi:uncharacterized protein (UPF0297 family)
MTERSKQFMDAIWKKRNEEGADTEEKLVSAILSLIPEYVTNYNAQNDMIVLDKNDVLNLSNELI